MQEFYIDSENTLVVDMCSSIRGLVEPEVQDDIHRFSVTTNVVKNRFIFFRVCNYILEKVQTCRKKNQKLLLYLGGEPLEREYIAAINTICKGLSVCLLVDKEMFEDFHKNICKRTGESKERKTRINCLCSKQLKNPDISSFTKLLLKKGIHKIDGKLNTLEVKLGLYTT